MLSRKNFFGVAMIAICGALGGSAAAAPLARVRLGKGETLLGAGTAKLGGTLPPAGEMKLRPGGMKLQPTCGYSTSDVEKFTGLYGEHCAGIAGFPPHMMVCKPYRDFFFADCPRDGRTGRAIISHCPTVKDCPRLADTCYYGLFSHRGNSRVTEMVFAWISVDSPVGGVGIGREHMVSDLVEIAKDHPEVFDTAVREYIMVAVLNARLPHLTPSKIAEAFRVASDTFARDYCAEVVDYCAEIQPLAVAVGL